MIDAYRAELSNKEAVQIELRRRRDEVAKRLEEITAQKSEIAHAALTGKSADQARLRDLNKEAAVLALSLQDHDEALKTANALVEIAAKALADAQERQKLNDLLAMLPEVRAAAGELTRAIDALPAAAKGFFDALGSLRSRGAPLVSHELIRVNLTRAIQVGLIPLRMNTEAIPPSERRTADSCAQQWLDACESRLKSQLAAVAAKEVA